jgi:hypothetical protein
VPPSAARALDLVELEGVGAAVGGVAAARLYPPAAADREQGGPTSEPGARPHK